MARRNRKSVRNAGRKAKRQEKTPASAGMEIWQKPTPRLMFFREMKTAMPWHRLVELVEPYYPKESNSGRPVPPLLWMLKLYFVQLWFRLSDLQTVDLVHDSYAVLEFLELDLERDPPPDTTDMREFRHLLEEHGLEQKILEVAHQHLDKAGIYVQYGRIVDATVIPPS